MQLTSIRLQNYRRFEDFSLDFQPGMNVLVGANGCGKTTILEAVTELLGGLLWRFGLNISNPYYLESKELARLTVTVNNGRYYFDHYYPIILTAKLKINSQNCMWEVKRMSEHQVGKYSNDGDDELINNSPKLNDNNIIAVYRSNRHFKSASPEIIHAVVQRQFMINGYQEWDNAAAHIEAFQIWIVSKCLERLQIANESGLRFDDIQDDDLAAVNKAITTALPEYGGMRYDLAQKSLLVTLNGKPKPFENLSDGQRNVVALLADIARRMCLLNPHLGVEAPQQTPGVVVIDELDMHLHPVWQRRIVGSLKKAFPLVQFIVASHSPQILGELKPSEIILLHEDEVSYPKASYGLDSSRVLEEIMQAEDRNSEVDQGLADLFKLLANNQLPEAREQLAKLEKDAPDLPEYQRAKALLFRKETIGR